MTSKHYMDKWILLLQLSTTLIPCILFCLYIVLHTFVHMHSAVAALVAWVFLQLTVCNIAIKLHLISVIWFDGCVLTVLILIKLNSYTRQGNNLKNMFQQQLAVFFDVLHRSECDEQKPMAIICLPYIERLSDILQRLLANKKHQGFFEAL